MIPDYYEFQNATKILSGKLAINNIPAELKFLNAQSPLLISDEILNYGKHIPFIGVPTTSGTGSEVTLVAVIEDKIKNLKMEFISYFLLPDVAVLDPEMTMTLPKKAAASTGIDALCHAIEAYTCIQKNPLSDAYAISAIKIIMDNI